MGLGILQDSRLDHVPGTTFILEDDSSTVEQLAPSPHLKYDTSGPTPIILVPQPSDDPNDPLNWPLWKRDAILAVLSFVGLLCATTSPLLAANTATLAHHYETTFTKAALLTGYHLCGVGVAGLLFVPSARVWGKRHLYILGCIVMIFSSAWGGASAGSYKSLLVARVFQGVGLAPYEALVNASVGDLFFVHERGKRMALSNVALFGGSFFTPVIVGKLTVSMGWEWTFNFLAIFSGACLPLVIFCAPETAFRRAAHLNTDFEGESSQGVVPNNTTAAPTNTTQPIELDTENNNRSSSQKSREEEMKAEKHESRDEDDNGHDPVITEEAARDVIPRKVTYWQSLKPFNGRKTDESYWKLLLRPLPLFLHPGILWACLTQGVLIGWTVFIGVVLAALFSFPPLWFTEDKIGYLYTGAFIGSIAGLVLSGLLADYSAKLLTKLNRGVYEPEFRIVLVLFQLVFSALGLYGFGYTTADVARFGYVVPDVFLRLSLSAWLWGRWRVRCTLLMRIAKSPSKPSRASSSSKICSASF
ncbi:MFS transporter [Blastomyces dermatitidis ATCC 18188]|uniref:MFS transporter n=1 Tax=Ajellomyces dermatitidis (strain ATCC 18188 / CBS 674.68) TaxID=653446 RepID=F2T2R5_AJEDA|nr:MFS transporter [Blastomyces dermatitidis ATCC 18188]